METSWILRQPNTPIAYLSYKSFDVIEIRGRHHTRAALLVERACLTFLLVIARRKRQPVVTVTMGMSLSKHRREKVSSNWPHYLSAGAAKAAVGACARFKRLDRPERRLCDRDDDQLREPL